MLYLDVMINENEDCLLYINGISYNEINIDYAECILWLRDEEILPKEIIINKRLLKGNEKFPDKLDYNSYDYRWQRIPIDRIRTYITKIPVKCDINGEIVIINPKEKLPDSIKFDALINGKWYKLID